MDLQTRKLNVIEYLIGLKSDELLNEIEAAIVEFKNEKSRTLVPFTKEQLIERAKKSNSDYLFGKVKTQKQLETESESW